MTRIIGISGRKQSGKNTSANHLCGVKLKSKGLIDDFRLADDGALQILTTNAENVQGWGELDMTRTDFEFIESAQERIWPYVKFYSFADALKQMCVSLFEIPYEQIYGTDEQKNMPTHLRWEDMPGVIDVEVFNYITRQGWDDPVSDILPQITDEDLQSSRFEGSLDWNGIFIHKPGAMTGRDVMQFFGTEVMRKIYGPVWINNTIKRIAMEQPELAIITDIRFPNEADGMLTVGAEVIRLLRDLFSDSHESETALDPDKYDYARFSFLVDNSAQPISFLQERLDKIYMGEIKRVEFVGFKQKEISVC